MSTSNAFENVNPQRASPAYARTAAASRLSHSKPVVCGANPLLKPANIVRCRGDGARSPRSRRSTVASGDAGADVRRRAKRAGQDQPREPVAVQLRDALREHRSHAVPEQHHGRARMPFGDQRRKPVEIAQHAVPAVAARPAQVFVAACGAAVAAVIGRVRRIAARCELTGEAPVARGVLRHPVRDHDDTPLARRRVAAARRRSRRRRC